MDLWVVEEMKAGGGAENAPESAGFGYPEELSERKGIGVFGFERKLTVKYYDFIYQAAYKRAGVTEFFRNAVTAEV